MKLNELNIVTTDKSNHIRKQRDRMKDFDSSWERGNVESLPY